MTSRKAPPGLLQLIDTCAIIKLKREFAIPFRHASPKRICMS